MGLLVSLTIVLVGGAVMAGSLAFIIRNEKRAKDQAASVTHDPLGPVPTSDQNNLVWTYEVTGLHSEINSFHVGPIDTDITTTNLMVDVPRWTATRSGKFVECTGPGNVLEGVTATASFQTTADSGIGAGTLQALIYVNIVYATKGVRPVTKVTHVPAKR
ncbi:hypothetical protein [Candidatus Nitrospira neomarina]|uniref:Uncharacterized protein n=1 Tax=Candidatus Nitrospira neomarina TaxID=3020899 RepID=A0AA96GKT8_9BACT|nr:hypothetical protein [Candidatus Nitrospira neomarina]WNM63786.1 hypothetical protein PQG83_08530 [Candidatus Nitrospira neomarina]